MDTEQMGERKGGCSLVHENTSSPLQPEGPVGVTNLLYSYKQTWTTFTWGQVQLATAQKKLKTFHKKVEKESAVGLNAVMAGSVLVIHGDMWCV